METASLDSSVPESVTKAAVAIPLTEPPGGLLIWIFIVLELATFAFGFIAFAVQRASAPDLFRTAQATLDQSLAAINTLVLLSSGFLVALGVSKYKNRLWSEASKLFCSGAILGIVFLVIKGSEYRQKLIHGQDILSNDFFTYYWALTGFHFMHVVLGVVILFAMAFKMRQGLDFADKDAGVETGAAFWHLCDLIWIVLFPLIYILR